MNVDSYVLADSTLSLAPEEASNLMLSGEEVPIVSSTGEGESFANQNAAPSRSEALLTEVEGSMTSSLSNVRTEALKDSTTPFDNAYCPISTSVCTVKRYNIMVAGQSGAGKSSFCYSTFRRHFPDFSMAPPDGPTEQVGECGRGHTVIGNDRIIVTVIDTVGHGGHNSTNQIAQILEYLEKQNLEYERNELYRNANNREEDTRIHCLFYFFGPHRVHDVDICFLRRLHGRVNIVPIVSKADSLTIWELAEQLQLIQALSKEANIQYFDFGESNINEGWLDTDKPFNRSDFVKLANAMGGSDSMLLPQQECLPVRPVIKNVFAVISNDRPYIWGTATENNPNHSDTMRLHAVLFGSLGKLALTTDELHEQWRLTTSKRSLTSSRTKLDTFIRIFSFMVAVICCLFLGAFVVEGACLLVLVRL